MVWFWSGLALAVIEAWWLIDWFAVNLSHFDAEVIETLKKPDADCSIQRYLDSLLHHKQHIDHNRIPSQTLFDCMWKALMGPQSHIDRWKVTTACISYLVSYLLWLCVWLCVWLFTYDFFIISMCSVHLVPWFLLHLVMVLLILYIRMVLSWHKLHVIILLLSLVQCLLLGYWW